MTVEVSVSVKDDLIELVECKMARVGVIGLGYVGLPLAVEFARKGFRAIGFEVDSKKADSINRGESYIGDVAFDSALQEVVRASGFTRRSTLTSFPLAMR